MDTRTDFQRLLEDMDRVIQSKRQELLELDERLEAARDELSQKEAKELLMSESASEEAAIDRRTDNLPMTVHNRAQLDEHIKQQAKLYLQQFGDELTELDSMNQELVKENELLRRELLRSQANGDKLMDNARKLELSLQEVQSANLALNLRLSKAEGELDLQEKLLKRSHQEDEVLMDALNDKLESLKRAIERRDEEIRRLRSDNQFVLNAFGMGQWADTKKSDEPTTRTEDTTNYSQQDTSGGYQLGLEDNLIDSESKQRVLEIVSAFREKDSQIELLKSQLLQATKDLERNANLLELSYQQQQQKLTGPSSQVGAESHQLNLATTNNDGPLNQELLLKSRMLESELEAKDKQMHLLEFRLHHYETILPNMISDLVQELLLLAQKYGQQITTTTTTTSGGGTNDDRRESVPLHEPTTNTSFSNTKLLNRIETAIDNLHRVLNGINLTHGVLDQVDRFKATIEAREARIRQLVMELNQMNAKFSLVQQQCDLLRSSEKRPEHYKQNGASLDWPMEAADLKGVRFHNGGSSPTQSVGELPQSVEGQESINSTEYEPTDKAEGSSVHYLNEQSIKSASDPLNLQTIEKPPIGQGQQMGMEFTAKNTRQQPTDGGGFKGGSHEGALGQMEWLAANDDKSESRSIKRLAKSHEKTEASSAKSNKALMKPYKCSFGGGPDDIGQALSLRTRLSQLENENELLELAMKEILLALKWSDGQCSSLLIDCPSLERLCQLIEARFLATATTSNATASDATGRPSDGILVNQHNTDPQLGDGNLFQFVVLKSELDLLRGQNEQLRVDVKSQRREYHELLRGTAQVSRLQFDATSNVYHKSEASCQTDPIHHEAEQQAAEAAGQNSAGAVRIDTEIVHPRCENCTKLIKLTGHLSQCIVRIETRVNVSDETYMNRMVGLHQLVRLLERDLSARESLLNGSRRECHLLVEQKLMLEARLQYVENQLNTHLGVCPMSHHHHLNHPSNTHQSTSYSNGSNMQVYTTAARNENGHSIQSLTIQQSQQSPRAEPRLMRNARMTISLLRSIINCLQARLDFKDERLLQLESLISGTSHHQLNHRHRATVI